MKRLIAEFVLIVVSVLVALTLEGQLQERADRTLVHSYIQSLRYELQRDTLLTRIFSEVSRRRSSSARLLLDNLGESSPGLTARDELIALYWAGSHATPLYTSSVVDELLTTGNARLLPDSLRIHLQRIADRIYITGAVISDLSFPLAEGVPVLIPGRVQLALRESTRPNGRNWVFDDANTERVADSLLQTSPEVASSVAGAWQSIPQIRDLLERTVWSSQIYTEELERNRRVLNDALRIVNRSP